MIVFDCISTGCPVCGGAGSIPDGKYRLDEYIVTLLAGPATTVEILQQLAQSISESKRRGDTPDEAVNKLSKILPTLGVLAKLTSSQSLLTWIGIALTAAQLLQPSLSKEDISEAIRDAITAEQKKYLAHPGRDSAHKNHSTDNKLKNERDGGEPHNGYKPKFNILKHSI